MTLHGMDALQRAITSMPDLVKDELSDVVAATTFAIAQGVRARVPRGATGILAGSIASSSRGMNGHVDIGVDAFYWHFLEYGTVKMPAKPFIRPAAEAEADVFERRLVSAAKSIEQHFTRGA